MHAPQQMNKINHTVKKFSLIDYKLLILKGRSQQNSESIYS